MSKSSQVKPEKLDILLEKAIEFHGHLGPFLVMGLRMGFVGLRELNTKRGEKKMRVIVKLNYSIPFSCTLDGLQIATKCTVGNKKLIVIRHSGIAAKFELEGEKQVNVAVNPAFFDMLKRKLTSESASSEEVRELAWLVTATPEEKLFIISRG